MAKRVTDLVNPLSYRQPEVLVNRIALVVDESGSMAHLKDKVIEYVNKQFSTVKLNAGQSGQATFVSLYKFNNTVRRTLSGAYPESLPLWRDFDYTPGGMTAMHDAVRQAIEELSVQPVRPHENVSYLVIVITDGVENVSRRGNVSDLIRRMQGTDRWSFAFLGPVGSRQQLEGLGIPGGNVQEWEQTEQGLQAATMSASAGISSYYTTRAAGRTRTEAFFTDLSSVKKSDLKKLGDVTDRFKKFAVAKEDEIRPFVEARGYAYRVGDAFYELTKTEKVQSHKDLVLMDRTTGKLYGGQAARDLVGLPSGPGVTVRVNPGNHANYKLFVSSTSTNRLLVRGTSLLYRVK